MRYLFIDADDTLWENEAKFRQGEKDFIQLITQSRERHGASPIASEEILDILEAHIEENLPKLGYGAKSMLVSMFEVSAAGLCGTDSVDFELCRGFRKIHDNISDSEVAVFKGVRETLQSLSKNFRLVLATKGDLVEQKRKIRASGLEEYFSHIEVMSDKRKADYEKLADTIGIKPEEMIMVGNSVRSDIIPVIELGGVGIYIPHHIIWRHEVCDEPESENLKKLSKFSDLAQFMHSFITE